MNPDYENKHGEHKGRLAAVCLSLEIKSQGKNKNFTAMRTEGTPRPQSGCICVNENTLCTGKESGY